MTWLAKMSLSISILMLVVRGAAAPVTWQCGTLSLTVGDDGKVTSIIDRVAGRERVKTSIPAYQRHFCLVVSGGVLQTPTSYSFSNGQLVYTFGSLSPAPVVTLSIVPATNYLTVRVLAVANPQLIDELRFVNLETRGSIDEVVDRFVRYNDDGEDRYLSAHPLDPWTQVAVGPAGAGGYLWGQAIPNLPYSPPVTMVGRKVGLMACPTSEPDLFTLINRMELDHNVPIGVAARDHPALRRSCFLWDQFEYSERQLAIQYTLRAGVGRVLLAERMWQDARRPDQPAPVWASSAELRGWVNQCKSNGIAVGAHVLPSQCVKNSRTYVLGGAHTGLRRDLSTTLAAALSADQTDGLIQTVTAPIGWPLAGGNRDVVIDSEIIQYSGLKTGSAPFGLLGPFIRAKNQSGPGGLGPRAHAAAAAVGHLVATDSDATYQWGLAAGGVAENCAATARLADAVIFDFIYTDAIERSEPPLRYSMGAVQHALYQALTIKPRWMESSLETASFSWSMVAVGGQTDYEWGVPYRGQVDQNVSLVNGRFDPFSRPQLGWGLVGSTANVTDFVTPDEFEYLLARSLAWNCPLVLIARTDRFLRWPHRDANLDLMNQYEQRRLAGYFPPDVVEQARAQRDFMLFRDQAGGFHFEPVARLPIASGSSAVRGFMTTAAVSGRRFVTLWSVQETPLNLRLDGVSVDDLLASDVLGAPVVLSTTPDGGVLIPVQSRVYIELGPGPDPTRLFGLATVEPR
ncbi:hypothetical protein RAS1_44040 [Phycisphaerae bacterium RAS1]|nr:hypothetical protein RAS1_44040 [Phycisphaerae bacterium RAS1]